MQDKEGARQGIVRSREGRRRPGRARGRPRGAPYRGDAAGSADLRVGWRVRAALLVVLAALAGAADTAYAVEGDGPRRSQESPAKAAAKQLAPDPRSDVAGMAWEVAEKSNCDNPSSQSCDATKWQAGLVDVLLWIVGGAGVSVAIIRLILWAHEKFFA